MEFKDFNELSNNLVKEQMWKINVMTFIFALLYSSILVIGAYLSTLVEGITFLLITIFLDVIFIARPFIISTQKNINRISRGEHIKIIDLFKYYSLSFKKPYCQFNCIIYAIFFCSILSYLLSIILNGIYFSLFIQEGAISLNDLLRIFSFENPLNKDIYYILFGFNQISSLLLIYHYIGVSYLMMQYSFTYHVARRVNGIARKRIIKKYRNSYSIVLSICILILLSFYFGLVRLCEIHELCFSLSIVISSTFSLVACYPLFSRMLVYENNLLIYLDEDYKMAFFNLLNEAIEDSKRQKK